MSSLFKTGSRGISSIVSFTLITAFLVVSVSAVFLWALPQLEKGERVAELEWMKAAMATLDDYVRIVSHSGNSTTRSLVVSVSKGEMNISNYSIVYSIDVGEELIKSGSVIREKNIWMTGFGASVELRLNYSNVELSANDLIKGSKKLQITKIGDKNGKPLVEVKVV